MRPLIGDWLVEATVPGGGCYTGTIAVRPAGRTIELCWEITAGRYFGIGLEAGGAWYVACGEDGEGLGLALMTRDGDLRWTPAPDRGVVGAGKLRASSIETGPARWRAGPAAAGLPFTGLVLAGDGDVLAARLEGGPVSRGLALPTAAGWAVAWYPRFDQTAILRYLPGRESGTWEAVWALGGQPGMAGEVLRPVP